MEEPRGRDKVSYVALVVNILFAILILVTEDSKASPSSIFLLIFQKVGSLSGSRKLWAKLKNFQLRLWTRTDEVDLVSTVRVNGDSKIKSCTEPNHGFVISNPGHSQDVIFVAENDSQSCQWMAALRQHQQDHCEYKFTFFIK